MLRIILTLFLELSYQQEQKIYCHKDENYYYGKRWVPISFQNNNKIQTQLEQNQEILQLIAKIQICNLNDKRQLILKQFQQNQLELIFWDQDHYLCKYIVFKFNFENNKLTHYEEILKDQITFQLPICTKFLKMYQINQQIFIFCEEELFIQFFNLERDQNSNTPFNLRISTTSKIDKQQNCNYELQYYQYIYLAFLNCQNWIIYVIKNNNFEMFIDSKYQNNQVLKSFSIQEEIILQFDNKVYIVSQYQDRQIYHNKSQQILFVFSQDQQHVIFLKGENKIELKNDGLNNILLITNQQIPKQVLKLDDKLIINYGDYLEVLERIDVKFILYISIDYLINEQLNYPFIYAFYQNQIIIMEKNILNPIISCNELMKYDYIFYTTNHLFEPNQLIKLKITSENNDLQIIQIKQYLRGTTFQFKLYKPFAVKRDGSSKIQVFNQTNLSCQKQQLQQESNCGNVSYNNIRWYKLKYYKELYLLYQNINLKLYLKNCNTNLLVELGRYENFEEKNIYEFQHLFLLIFQKQTKVLIIQCQSNFFNQTIIEFKDEIIDICYENYITYIISKSCNYYFLFNKQNQIFQNKQYLQIDGKCIQTLIFNDYLGYVHEGSIIMKKHNITNNIRFGDASVINIFKIYSYQYSYIFHLKNQDGEYFSKYLFINNQFIKLYDFPKYNFKFSSPLIYKITQYLIIVAAYENSSNHVLLIYYCNNDYQNSLIDFIQVDNFNFYMSDQDILIYNFNKEIQMIDVKYDQFKCEISLFSEFIKNITFPLNLISKFDDSQDCFSTLNLNLYNLNKNLSHKESKLIQLEMQESIFPLDPRQYINGPIDQIIATDLLIVDPIQKQGKISKLQCQKLINQVCINYNNNQLIFNPFSKQEIITLEIIINSEIQNIIKFQDLIFILYEKENQFTIQVYNTHELFSYFLQIPQLCNDIIHMQIYLYFYILICPRMIYFYKIHDDHSLKPFSSLQTKCNNCQIMEITNSNFTLLYILNNNMVQEISLITIYDDNYHDYSNRTKIQIFNILKANQPIFIIQNITYLNSSYYEILLLKQELEGFLYYFEAFLDEREGITIQKEDYVLIRHFQYIENVKNIYFLDKDIIIILVNDSPINNTIQIYNVSNAFNLKYIDYIFNFQLDNLSKILPYDNQHFIIDSYEQNDYCLYKLEPYRLMLKEQKQDNMFIEFQNSVSSLRMQISIKTYNYVSINYYFVSIVIVVLTILIYFLLKCLNRNKHIHLNKSKEIEL